MVYNASCDMWRASLNLRSSNHDVFAREHKTTRDYALEGATVGWQQSLSD